MERAHDNFRDTCKEKMGDLYSPENFDLMLPGYRCHVDSGKMTEEEYFEHFRNRLREYES